MNSPRFSHEEQSPRGNPLVGIKSPRKFRILVVDDETANVTLLRRFLTKEGYEVVTAGNGEEALTRIRESTPDLILMDILMPVMDGLAVCRKLRADIMTRSIPIILLTALNSLEDRLEGLRTGVDDFVSKPFYLEEIKVRVEGALQRRLWDQASQPLTHLPGGAAIEEEVWKRLRNGSSFAFAYIDIDQFKAYNDVYGFDEGDRIIKALAESLMSVVCTSKEENTFSGHIGGDDFILMTSIPHMKMMLPRILQEFDDQRVRFYRPEDWERGGLQTKNRKNEIQTFPLMTLSAAIVTTETRRILHYGRLVGIATELKHYVKLQEHAGHSLAIWDRRSDPHMRTPHEE